MAGSLILVVGPSGVGKDALLNAARKHLVDSSVHYFPRRLITRPKSAGGENHIAVTLKEFKQMEINGDFALSWRAHGLAYGIPRSIVEQMAQGKTVIVNVSREVIDHARKRFVSVRVARIMAPNKTLRERLLARGRESEADIEKRLHQAFIYKLKGEYIHEVDNGGSLKEGTRQFLEVINC